MSFVARVIGTLFFAMFLAAGLFFAVMLGRDVGGSLKPWFWAKTDCVILESSVREDFTQTRKVWHADIRYAYTDPTTGVRRTSDRVKWKAEGGSAAFEDASEAHRLVRRFPADARAVCYAPSGTPDDAVLIRATPWIALAMLFPLIFVAVGGGGVVAMWWPWSPPSKSKAISQRVSGRRALLFVRGFFFLFLAAGGIVGYALFARPMWKIVQARDWPAVPCTIVSSRVATHRDSDGDTYSVDIHYRYEVAGERFDGNRYSFFTGSSGGAKGKRAIVKRFKPGSPATCFVNPNDPTDVVLERGPVGELWFALIPAIFCIVGLLGMIFVRPQGAPGILESTPSPGSAIMDTGSVTLATRTSRMARFLGILVFAVLWNGVVAVLFWKAADAPLWFKAIFALAGLALAAAAFYQFLSLFSPRPIIVVNRQALPLGGELRLDWSFRGNPRRIRRLRIFLRGTEEATYRRGTDTTTDRHTFTEITLVDETDAAALSSGEATATIPADSMHTFAAPNNKIVWSLHVNGEIPRWPDVDEEFPIHVLPLRVAS